MARIKAVLNERRLAYEGAVKMHAENREKLIAEQAAVKEAEERANTPVTEPEQPKIVESTPASLPASALLGGAQPEIVEEKQKTSS